MIAWETKIMTECTQRCKDDIATHEKQIALGRDRTGFNARCIADIRQQMKANRAWYRQIKQAQES